MGGQQVEQRGKREQRERFEEVEHELGLDLLALGGGVSGGLLGLVAAAWSRVPMEVAAAASLPGRAEYESDSVHSGRGASTSVRGAWTSGSR